MKDAAPTSKWSRLPIIGPLVRLFSGKAAGADGTGEPLSGEPKLFHCGTLTYTKAGVVAVFAWLLWGDFCFTIMEAVVPTVLPLKMKALASPNWLMGLILSTIPNILNMTICPAVSFKSDRYRSRWGRRIPFIVWTLPFLVISLIMLGCSDEIGAWLQKHMTVLREVAPTTIVIALIGVFMTIFQFFNMFVASVFWYLFNDVVPAQYQSRFAGSFRIVGNLAGATYNFFVFKYAGTNMREILVGGALLYFFGFALMCVMVREGQYPPVTAEEDRASRGLRGVMTFLKESFSHKWYWLFFLWGAIPALASGMGIFGVFFNLEMGLTLDNIGKLGAFRSIAAMCAMYMASVFVDRWHPMRVQVYVYIFVAFAAFSNWIWIFVTLPGKYYFWLSLSSGLIGAFFSALAGVCGFPLLMRLFPKSRFGQFCSAQSLVNSLFGLFSGVAAGLFADTIVWLCRNSGHGPYFVYRFNFLWSGFFAVLTAAVAFWCYVYWHRLGADKGYQPPAPWLAGPIKFDARGLSLDALMWVPATSLPALIWLTYSCRSLLAVQSSSIQALFYALAGILGVLFALGVWISWSLFRRAVPRDVARCRLKKPPKNGFTHADIVGALCFKYFLILFGCAAQVLFVAKLVAAFESELLHSTDQYRFLWAGSFVGLAAVLAVWAYAYWKRRSRPEPSAEPVTEAPGPDLTEELETTDTIPPQSRWLNVSLRLFDATMWLSVLSTLPLMWWMHQRGATIALRWYAQLVLPYLLAVWIGWKFLERGIRNDMTRSLRNEPLHNGIPHHGVLMAISIQYLLALGIWIAQVLVTLKLNMEWECILFGIANIVTNFLLTGFILVIWRMERGRSNILGTGGDGAKDFPTSGVAARVIGLFRKKPCTDAT